MSIAVLMTCHNRVETTLACLRRLMPQLSPTDGVFLVDDGSMDGTGVKVKAEFSDVNVINGDGTLYWARGMHLAWESAIKSGGRFDFFLWLNDDVMLNPAAISSATEDWRHTNDTSSVIVGACSEDEGETVISYGATDDRDIKIVPYGKMPQRATGWFTGNFVLIPQSACRKVGIISPDYRHARADYDYAERLKHANIPFYVSSHYVGSCPCDFESRVKGRKLGERMRWLVEPSYYNLHDLFLFKKRHYGLIRAMLSCAHLVFIVLKGS